MDFKNKEVFILGPRPSHNQVLKKIGTRCEITDFAILLGGKFDLMERTGWYATYDALPSNMFTYDATGIVFNPINHTENVLSNKVEAVDYAGIGCFRKVDDRSGGIRPVIYFDDLKEVMKNAKQNTYGVLETTYGEYPQFVVPWRFTSGHHAMKTGKKYITDSRLWDETSMSFSAREYEEYICNGTKYICVEYHGVEYRDTTPCILSNHKFYYPGDVVRVKISPIVWYIDEEENRIISKYLLASGIRFCSVLEYDGNFRTTEMYKFLNENFAQDIIPSIPPEMKENTLSLKRTKEI